MLSMRRQKLFFIHIGKTGGVSFEHILKQNFAEKSICPYYYDVDFVEHSDDPLDYQLFFGHNWHYTLDILPPHTQPTTFLRNPTERLLSAYEHTLRDKNHKDHNDLNGCLQAPGALLQDQDVQTLWSNAQTRVLGRDYDFGTLLQRCVKKEIKADDALRELQHMRLAPATRDTLERAKTRLRNMQAFGLTDQFDKSCQWLAKAFHLRIGNIPHMNTASQKMPRSDLYSKEDFAAVEAINDLDIELYNYALSLFRTKTA